MTMELRFVPVRFEGRTWPRAGMQPESRDGGMGPYEVVHRICRGLRSALHSSGRPSGKDREVTV
jgi:hypothetical protein